VEAERAGPAAWVCPLRRAPRPFARWLARFGRIRTDSARFGQWLLDSANRAISAPSSGRHGRLSLSPKAAAGRSPDSVLLSRRRGKQHAGCGPTLLRDFWRRCATASRRSEPGRERVREPWASAVSRPGDVSVGPDQHCGGCGDRAQYRELPWAGDRVQRWAPIGVARSQARVAVVSLHRPGIQPAKRC
jgi:hypothetical protein